MQALLKLILVPLLLFNLLAGIVGGVWLLLLGEWRMLGGALLATILGMLLSGTVSRPGMLALAHATLLRAKGGPLRVAYLLLFAGILWACIVMSAWALCWFEYFRSRSVNISIVPRLLVAFSVATGPWEYMAQRDPRTGGPSFGLLFFKIACFTAFVMLAFAGAEQSTTLATFLVIMGIALILEVGMGVATAESPDLPSDN
jgi:hypothetical protein